MFDFKKYLAKQLREVADKLDADATDLSASEMADIMSMVIHQAMSKEQACTYLNLSRSRFDDLVRERKIPKGKKRVGFKELVWFKDELEMCKRQ